MEFHVTKKCYNKKFSTFGSLPYCYVRFTSTAVALFIATAPVRRGWLRRQ